MAWLDNLVEAIVSPFTKLTTAVMSNIGSGFKELFLEVSTDGTITGPSPFAYFVFLGLGISLCLGLTKWITSFARKKI